MKKLDNIKLIKARIQKVAQTAPAAPLKGRGHNRHELHFPRVFPLLQKHAPAHCEVVINREKTNSYGKLGFVGHPCISPELDAVFMANIDDFQALENALALVEKFGL